MNYKVKIGNDYLYETIICKNKKEIKDAIYKARKSKLSVLEIQNSKKVEYKINEIFEKQVTYDFLNKNDYKDVYKFLYMHYQRQRNMGYITEESFQDIMNARKMIKRQSINIEDYKAELKKWLKENKNNIYK